MTVKEENKMFEKIRANVKNGLGFVEAMKLEKVGKRFYEPTLRKYIKWAAVRAEVFDVIDVEELGEEDANLITSIKKDVDRMIKSYAANLELYKKMKVALM
jgi:hypothetical protein